jgi:hypothetical protein
LGVVQNAIPKKFWKQSMKNTKKKIEEAVKQYTQMFPSEYAAFLKSHKIKQDDKLNDFAEVKGGDHLVRHLMDMPETLYFALKQNLLEDEMDWLFSKNTHVGKREGISWFIRRFPQFRITADF